MINCKLRLNKPDMDSLSFIIDWNLEISQDVRDDPDAPHVRVEGDGLEVDDLGADELGRAQHLAQLVPGVDLPAEAEVDQLEQRAVVSLQHDVLRLRKKNKEWQIRKWAAAYFSE